MLVAFRLACLSALGAHYARVKWRATRADAKPNAASPASRAPDAPLANPKDGVLATPPSAAPALHPLGSVGIPAVPIAGRGESPFA